MAEPIYLSDDDAFEKLQEKLKSGIVEPAEWFKLRNEAEAVALSPGFDTLLSLSANNIDEYQHQIDAALTALRRMRGRVILADEVGLGKTIEAGIILKELLLRGLVKRVLILVPASLTLQWQQEMVEKFNEDFVIAHDSSSWVNNRVIASIDLAKRSEHASQIQNHDYDLLIIDEAHRLKNRQSVAWRFANDIRRKYMLLLTATPVHNNLSELYSLVTLVKPGVLRTYTDFKARYIDSDNPLNPHHFAELKALVSEVMIRNRRSSVQVKLPPRTAYTYKLKLSKEERTLYDSLTQYLATKTPSDVDMMTRITLMKEVCSSSASVKPTLAKVLSNHPNPQLEQIYAMAETAAHASKIDAVTKIVKKTRDKVIVFTDYIESMKMIAEALSAEGISVQMFHGGLTSVEKNTAVQHFKESDQVLVSTESGGEGSNLQFCNVMVNYDIPWNPMKLEQRIGRIHRLGQKKEVFVFNLSAEQTIEADILELLVNKIRMFELVVGELDLILGNMTTNETFESTLRDILLCSDNEEDRKLKLTEFSQKIDDARNQFDQIKEAEVIVSRLFE